MFKKFLFLTFCDAAEIWQFNVQDSVTPIMEGMASFHNYLMFYVIFIGFCVCWLLYIIVKEFNEFKLKKIEKFNRHSLLEIVWTIVPAVLLIIIAIPSFSLLYSLDKFKLKKIENCNHDSLLKIIWTIVPAVYNQNHSLEIHNPILKLYVWPFESLNAFDFEHPLLHIYNFPFYVKVDLLFSFV